MSYYIDLVIAGVQDYLATKGLAIDENAFSDPNFYFMFEQDPATWDVGQHLISLDGSDLMTNPTYLALNQDVFNSPPVQVNLPDENTPMTLNPGFFEDTNSNSGSLTLDPGPVPDIVQFPGAIADIPEVRKSLSEIANAVKKKNVSDVPSKSEGKVDEEVKNDDSAKSPDEKEQEDAQNKVNGEQQTKTSESQNGTIEEDKVNSETESENDTFVETQQNETDKNLDNQKDAQNKVNDEQQTKISENANDMVEEDKVNSETESENDAFVESQQNETDKNLDNQRVKEKTESIHSDDTQVVETEHKPEVKEEPVVVKTTTDTTKTVDKKAKVKTVTIPLDKLNETIKRLNDSHKKLVTETEKLKVGEKETTNDETEGLSAEMINAIQSFNMATFDAENGFKLLITDSDGKPSSLFYCEENGTYYRLDDTSKTPIDMTKSHLKLTESEYKSYLAKLNEQSQQNDDIEELAVAGMDVKTQIFEQPTVSDGQPQTSVTEQQVYAPQTQQVGSALTPEQQAYVRQANIQQPQTQSLTPEQQAQQVQQQQMQAQQQALQQEQEKKEEEKANFLVKTGNWIQKNIFDTIGDFIPIPFLGKGIKMIGNVFTGLLKTIGHIFDGNWKKMVSDGWSWLKDTAIVGGATFGIYKLGKSLDWWGKDKAKQSTSGLSVNNLTDEQVAKLAQKVVTGNGGVLASAAKPLTTLVTAQNNALENSGASSMLRKTASVATQNETLTDIITQNTKTM